MSPPGRSPPGGSSPGLACQGTDLSPPAPYPGGCPRCGPEAVRPAWATPTLGACLRPPPAESHAPLRPKSQALPRSRGTLFACLPWEALSLLKDFTVARALVALGSGCWVRVCTMRQAFAGRPAPPCTPRPFPVTGWTLPLLAVPRGGRELHARDSELPE